MDSQQLNEITKKFPFLLYYQGNYKTDLSSYFFEIIQANLNLHFKGSFVKRVSYLIIECIQNVTRYSDTQGSIEDHCIVYSDANYCHIMTKNRIAAANVEGLRVRLEEVKNATLEEIEEAFKVVMRSENMTSKGAGLGLLDMARKTGKRLEYEIKKISDQEYSYSLHIKLPIPNVQTASELEENECAQLINELITQYEKNSTLFYSGDFSNKFLMSLLNMITEQHQENGRIAPSIFKYVLIELSQNIHRHGARNAEGKVPAILIIEWFEENIHAFTSNYTSGEIADKMMVKVEMLNNATEEELNTLSENVMNDDSGIGGLGLIDIARLNRPNKIDCSVFNGEGFAKSINFKIVFNYEHRTI